MTFGLSTVAGADASAEAEFLQKINADRAANGLAPLSADTTMRQYARSWSQHMLEGNCPGEDAICHGDFPTGLSNLGVTGWSRLGENVGAGGSVDSLHNAFMNSDGHRVNILGNYNYVGIGVRYNSEGRMYVSVVFMLHNSWQGVPTTQPAPPSTQPAPATTQPAPTTTSTTTTTTTTTTTLPPTTTTTLVVGPDKPVTPGESCPTVTKFWWMCHD